MSCPRRTKHQIWLFNEDWGKEFQHLDIEREADGNIKAVSIFHNKILRGFLKLSNSSPKPALYFLLGELPVEGRIHIATLMLFHTIWANPDTTVHKMTDYILMMSKENSTTWSNHVRILCKKYGLPCPLLLLQSGPAWSREKWKTLVTTKVTVYIEKELREIAEYNSRMNFLNVKLLGLSGQAHPVLQGINTTQQINLTSAQLVNCAKHH